ARDRRHEREQLEADVGQRPHELRGLLVVEPQAVVGVHSLPREYAASVGGLFAFGLRSTFFISRSEGGLLMPVWGWVLIAVAVVAIVALLVMRITAKRKTSQLQEQFGPEYDR